LIETRASQYVDHPAFFCRDCAPWGAYYGTVIFDHSDGKIKAENGDVLGSWSPGTWYRVKVVLDRRSNKYSVWINGELRGQNIPTSRSDTNRINAIALVSGWPGKKVYYDDVRVFIVVQQQYYLRVRLDSVTLNGQDLSTSNPELKVDPGSRITGTVTFTVENVQPGGWITPVIWVTSWEKGTVSDGGVRVVANDIRSTRQFTVNIDVTAPSSPGTYYIGFFAGWMYNADEVASNDHPPNYGDGDDVWDMPGQGWEEVISNGQATTGPYRMSGRAIRIVVQPPKYTTVKVTIQAIDGFGAVRNDWLVVVENVATGMGQITTELVEGEEYKARVTALGFTNTTTFVAKGPQMVIRVKIPTAKIEAQVVDGFGEVMRDEIVEIIGAASGQVTVSRFVPSWFGPVEVLGGQQYVVKTVVFGKEFSQTVDVPVGQIVTVQLQVPTARLSITVVDDVEKPIDKYVSSVELTGPLNLMFYSAPPKDIKVLAGTYNITVIALGKKASASVTLNAGETKNIQIVVPGTAGLDFMGARIPLLTLVPWVLALVVVAVAAVTLIVRRRGRTDTIEHIGDETRTRVMRF
jgi:hypothetical protein